MRKVALIRVERNDRFNDEYDYKDVADYITDWTEVSDEDFEILKTSLSYNYRLIECVPDQEKIIGETVSQYLERVKAEQKKREEQKRKREVKAKAMEKEKLAKKAAKLKKDYEKALAEGLIKD